MVTVVGVDGARVASVSGWVAVRLQDGQLSTIAFHDDLASIFVGTEDARAIGIDVPIGHDDPEGTRNGGRRACDTAAKAVLGSRHASVFLASPPAVLAVDGYDRACAFAESRDWIKPSRQLWAIRDRIREVGPFAAKDPRIREVHPETSFQVLAEILGRGAHLAHPKSGLAGVHERLALLHAAGLRPERSTGGVGRLSPDDILDATVAAWSAMRIAEGSAVSFPENPPSDPATGRAVAIWS